MARSSLERLEVGVLATHSPFVDVAYFDFSPNNHRRGGRDSVAVIPQLIVDVSSVRRRLLGIEVLNASRHLDGIVDLSTFSRYNFFKNFYSP